MAPPHCVIFDLDGTLLDTDEALVQAFLRLGLARNEITFGHPIEEFCADHGLSVADYVAAYDTTSTAPFDGVPELLSQLNSWAVCSNKHPQSGHDELRRLGWQPDAVAFSDAFGGTAKSLGPVLDMIGRDAASVAFVGDTDHDEACAAAVGCTFVWAGWNPRTRAGSPAGLVAAQPADVLSLLGLR